MIARKLCPYQGTSKHYIEIEMSLDSLDCPVCGKPILVSHCLREKQYGSRKTHGVSLHIPRGESRQFKEKIVEYVRGHAGKSVVDVASAFGCSHGKMWYILKGMPDEIVIEKRGRRCFVGVRG